MVLGKGRVALLEAIDEHKSIRSAAAFLGMSYRRAWLLVKSMNDAADGPLVESLTGGLKGGGARITAQGQAAIKIYRRYEAAIRKSTERFLSSL